MRWDVVVILISYANSWCPRALKIPEICTIDFYLDNWFWITTSLLKRKSGPFPNIFSILIYWKTRPWNLTTFVHWTLNKNTAVGINYKTKSEISGHNCSTGFILQPANSESYERFTRSHYAWFTDCSLSHTSKVQSNT